MKMNIYEIYYIQDSLFSSLQCEVLVLLHLSDDMMLSIFKVTSQNLPFINNFFNINSFCRYIGQNAEVGTRVSGGEIVLKLLSKTLRRMQIELWKQIKSESFSDLQCIVPKISVSSDIYERSLQIL